MTREEIESALDTGRLKIHMRNGNWWRVRRNGKTKMWKTRPHDFRIPIKFGLKLCGEINQGNMNWDDCWRIES